MQNTAQAQADVSMGTLEMSNDSVTTTDGLIENVVATVAGEYSYELPGGDPQRWIVDLRVSDGDVWETIGQTTEENQYAQYSGSYTVEGDLIEQGPFDQSFFSAPGPGKQQSVELPFEVRFQVIGSDETVLARSSIKDTATVTVGQEEINASLYGEIGGTGSVNITK